MKFKFACECGQVMEVDEKLEGRKIKCKYCATALRVPRAPPEPPEKLKKKFGGKKTKRMILYAVGCAILFPFSALFVLLDWLKQDLTCDACGYKTNAEALEQFIGHCPECAGWFFSGDVNWENKTVVPLLVVTVTSTKSSRQRFRGEEGWEIVLQWRKFQRF